MKITFTTKSGSIYVIEKVDDETMTWKRMQAGEGSVYVRTESGTLLQWPVVTVGSSCELIGPPLNPLADIRYMLTTPVVSIQEETAWENQA